MKFLCAGMLLALNLVLFADEQNEQEPVNLKWWIEHYASEDKEFLLVGDAKIPMDWFLKASPFVKRKIQDWHFTFPRDDHRRIIGTLNENHEFITWPGARVFPEGEYPEGIIFYHPRPDGSGSGLSVTF